MTLARSDILRDLQRLGVVAGDVVIVHSSLSSLGHVDGGANAVIDALLDAVGADGTLLMPSFQAGSQHAILRAGCTFDLRTSPCELGTIPETFRQLPGVIRSIHPTHCTAGIGPRAAEMLDGHQYCRVSVGQGSPYDRLVKAGGKILLLGVTHKVNTTLHLVENTGGAPTIGRELFEPVAIDTSGRNWTVPTHPHLPALQRNYPRAEDELRAAGIQVNGAVGQATGRLIQARPMAERLKARLREDPLYLINVFTP